MKPLYKPHLIPSTGDLLLSKPSLGDAFFQRSLVMLADHGADGSFGFILNQPLAITLDELLPGFESEKFAVHLGGPVQTGNLFFVHNNRIIVNNSQSIVEGVYWGGDFAQVQLLIKSGLMGADDLRFYLGYSGWSAGQLQKELDEGSWILLRAHRDHVFGNHTPEMWKKTILQMGEEYIDWVNYPTDPSLN